MINCDCNGTWCAVCGPKQQRVESVTVPVAAIEQLKAQLHDANLHADDFAEECHRQREENEKLRNQLREMCEAIIDNQWDMDMNEDNHWCHFCASQIGGPHNDCVVTKAQRILKDLEG